MYIVILTALGVGGATIAGAAVGFFFKNISEKHSSTILSFAAGVMLAASVFGLIEPALETGGLLPCLLGIFSGGICMDLMERMVTRLRPQATETNHVMLFVAAIAIHNLPEGIAAGVGFGTGDTANALMIAGGIALQNIPEGMVIIGPMLSTGMSPGRTFLYALATGVIEVVGTFLGYYAITTVISLLPFALSFAAGTMIFIICDEMIPQTRQDNSASGYGILAGFSLMLAVSVLL